MISFSLVNITLKYYCKFIFFYLLKSFYFFCIIVDYSIFSSSKNRGSMDPVHKFMDPVHRSGPRRGSMNQGSIFCTLSGGSRTPARWVHW